jgi:hypothetical protein
MQGWQRPRSQWTRCAPDSAYNWGMTHRFRKKIIYISILFVVAAVSISRVPVRPNGLIYSLPDEQGVSAFASGIYMGNGIVLTNWHVLKSLSWQQEYFKLPLWNEHIYNVDIPIEWVIFMDKGIDLAIGKLAPSRLDRLNIDYSCLSNAPLQIGELLTVTSSPWGAYPPVTAHLVVTNAIPQPHYDLDPLVHEEKRNTVISLVTTVQSGEEKLVDGGSSGGAVTNQNGQLVGLLWSRYDLPNGEREVLVTPVSAWLPLLKEAEIAPRYKEYILDQVCK